MKGPQLYMAYAIIVGAGFFVLAFVSTYTLTQFLRSSFDPVDLALVCVIAGLAEIFIGYESMVIFGGGVSLLVAEGISRVTGSRQVIEERRREPTALKQKLISELFLLYVPIIMFVVTVAIAWDLYNADSVHSGSFQTIFHALDIFSRPAMVNVVSYSVEVTPLIVLFSFLAGIVPSMSLPYFRKFNVTGVNGGPFHTTFMIALVGFVAGISVLFTLFGLFYEALLLNRLPFFHYVLLFAAGISLYYGVGSYLGLEKAEAMVRRELAGRKRRHVLQGSVTLTPSD